MWAPHLHLHYLTLATLGGLELFLPLFVVLVGQKRLELVAQACPLFADIVAIDDPNEIYADHLGVVLDEEAVGDILIGPHGFRRPHEMNEVLLRSSSRGDFVDVEGGGALFLHVSVIHPMQDEVDLVRVFIGGAGIGTRVVQVQYVDLYIRQFDRILHLQSDLIHEQYEAVLTDHHEMPATKGVVFEDRYDRSGRVQFLSERHPIICNPNRIDCLSRSEQPPILLQMAGIKDPKVVMERNLFSNCPSLEIHEVNF